MKKLMIVLSLLVSFSAFAGVGESMAPGDCSDTQDGQRSTGIKVEDIVKTPSTTTTSETSAK